MRASDINEAMKLAASHALAEIAEMPVEGKIRDILGTAYPNDLAAGIFDGACPLKNTYVIPKPFDPRVVPHVARFVAKAAMESGVAKLAIDDLDKYEEEVFQRISGK